MRRLREGRIWTLFDPADVPLLLTTHGADFSAAYELYERSAPASDHVSTSELWTVVCRAQQESGTPFIMYQDSINGEPSSPREKSSSSLTLSIAKNNHSHLGVIRTSNLCTEIVQFCSEDHTAVCTLASIALPGFVGANGAFDFDALHRTTELATLTTNAFIDSNNYPTESTRQSALSVRALGIGTQGFADTLMACKIAFDSADARELNRTIFETIYHAAYSTSCTLAARDGTYPKYNGSPAQRGVLQHEMWPSVVLSGRYDFDLLKQRISTHGLRNSMLTAQMPTASTAKLMGNFDSVEPYARYVTGLPIAGLRTLNTFRSNVVTHRILSGDYTEFCPWLITDLTAINLWSEEVRLDIIRSHGTSPSFYLHTELLHVVARRLTYPPGSIQNIDCIPPHIKEVYRTVWEINPKVIIDLAADRAPFIDQTQSTTLNVQFPTTDLLVSRVSPLFLA